MIESYNIQYGTNYISVMPTNLYGPNDNYDLEKSHVLPALIRKMHLAQSLETNNWEAIKKDFNKKPLEGLNGSASEADLLKLMAKYGITKSGNQVEVALWGTGTPRREFLNSNDMADACVFLLENVDFKDVSAKSPVINTHINIGTGRDLTIRELAELVKKIVGFAGKLTWDSSKPDGTMQKLLDVSKLNSLGWKETIGLEYGITSVYKQYAE